MYKNLSFPLNVYASLLELDNKPVDYLHFGLFQSATDDVYLAQQHSTDKILQHLPKAPANLLEIGMGLGTLQKVLWEKGYQAQGVTPDQAQYDIALKKIGPKAHIHCTRFEDFGCTEPFDALISQESAQYIDIIHLFSKAMPLIKEGGRLILIDEVSLNPDQPGNEALHHPDHLRFLAQSVGLQVSFEEDLSHQAKQTMQYLQSRLIEHRNTILQLIDNNEAQLVELEKAIQVYIDNYNTNKYGYRLMVFDKKAGTSNNIQYLEKMHLNDFQRLFEDAFKHRMNDALWHWKYQQVQAHSIGYWKQSQLVGHYGGFVRDIHYFGQRQQAIQIGDTMVMKKEQGRLVKNGIFHQLARIFLQRFIGYGAPYLLGFGFPNARVMQLAETLQLYQTVGRITRLSWQPEDIKAHPLYKVRPLSEHDQSTVNTLWDKMAKTSQAFIIGVRNWQRIQYRYLQHPELSYDALKINHRFTNKAIAILILKQEVIEQTIQYQLIDFICDPKHIPLVVRTAIRFSWQKNQAALFTLISENMKAYFSAYPFREDDPQISIPHSICTPGPAVTEVNNKWWLMAGDSDFM